MCDKAVDDSVAALKIIPDWFVTSKMIKELFTPLYAVENILYFNEHFGNTIFFCNGMGILNIDLYNINLDNFDEDDPDTIILIRLLTWQIKPLKKELASKRWWIFCVSENEKREIEPIFTEGL